MEPRHRVVLTWMMEGYREAKSRVAIGSWYIPLWGGRTKAPEYWSSDPEPELRISGMTKLQREASRTICAKMASVVQK
jgi:hypothetical protein